MNIVAFPFRTDTRHTLYRGTPPVEIYASRSPEGLEDSLPLDRKKEFTTLKHRVQEGDQYYECHIALRGFTIYESPRPSRSVGPEEYKKSDALYLAEHQADGRIFVLQYLPPHSHTSCHDHDHPVLETYYGIAGEAVFLLRGNNDVLPEPHHIHLRQGDVHHFTGGVTHQVRTSDTFCIVLIKIIGHKGTLETLVHNYRDWSADSKQNGL